MRFRTKLGMLLAAGALAVPLAVAVTAPPAHAATGTCWYWQGSNARAYLNAWNGGPFVKVYLGCTVANGSFTLIQNGPSAWQLKFTGDSPWAGRCIGNANNDPNNESTSLDTCQPAGWGTNFTLRTTGFCGAGQFAFQNQHSGGYLGPPDPASNGSPWFLNKPQFFCFNFT